MTPDAEARPFLIAIDSATSATALFEQLFAAARGLSGIKTGSSCHGQYKRREECAQDVRFAWLRRVTPFLPNRKPSPRERASNQPSPGCVSS